MNESYLNSVKNTIIASKPSTAIRLLLMVFFVCSFANVASAQKTWNGSSNTNWNTPANWSGSAIPVASDNVVIPAGYTVVINTSPSCTSLNISGTLTIGNNITDRTVTVYGDVTVNNGGVFNSAGDGGNTLLMGGNVVNNGIFAMNIGTALAEVTLNGASSQTVSGSGTTMDFNSITLTNAFPLVINRNITVNSDWTNNGKIVSGMGIVTLTGTSTIGGSIDTVFPNLTVKGIVTQGRNTTVSGDFALTTGNFKLNNGSTRSLTISGNYIQTGGTFDFNSGTTGTSNVFVAGNFSNSSVAAGSITTSGAGAPNGTITFNGTGTQILTMPTSGAAIWTKYIVNTASTVQLASALTLSSANVTTQAPYTGAFTINGSVNFGSYQITQVNGVSGAAQVTLNSGATLITANAGGIDGSVSSTNIIRTFNPGANYVFNGTTSQSTSLGMPSTINNLTITNNAGVTLTKQTAITNDFSITSGAIANLGTFTHSAGFLSLGGEGTISGSWGSTSSPATNKTNVYFAATTGIVNYNCTSPIITTQPLALTICQNTGGSFNVVTSASSPTFQWQYSGDNINWTNIDAALGTNASNYTSAILTLSNTPVALTGNYIRCIVRSSSGCRTNSNSVLLTVNPTPVITPNKVGETCPSSNNGSISPIISGGLSSVRYIKLTQKYVNADAWQQVAEIEAFEIFTGTNLARSANGATATSSTNYLNDATGYGPQKAIDGNSSGNNNFWHSNSTNINEWIKVDLQSGKNIDFIKIYNRTDCCSTRGQNMLLELFDASNTLIYSKTIDLFQSGANVPVNVNVLDVSWADTATATLNRTGLDSGDYTLNYTDAVGCSMSSLINIASINTAPAAPIIGAITQPNCITATGGVALSGLPATGTWTIIANPATASLTGTSGSGLTTTIGGLNAGTNYTFTVSNGSCSSSASGVVRFSAAVTKTWTGTIWVISPSTTSVAPPMASETAILNGNYTVNGTNGNINACSLIINSPAVLTITDQFFVTIQNDLTVNSGARLDVANQGSLIMISDTGIVTNNGTTKINKTTSPFKLYDYTYWSSPIVSTVIATTFSTWTTDRAYAFHPENFNDANNDGFDDNGDDWLFASSMNPGRGYIIMGPTSGVFPRTESVAFAGKVNNGVVPTPINLTPGSAIDDNFNLVGNPYPSAIAADELIKANIIGTGTINKTIDGTLYFWTHNMNIGAGANLGPDAANFSSDDYAVYNLSGGTGTSGSLVNGVQQSNKPLGFIASGQGFFVQANAAGLLTFNNAMRVGTSNTQFYKMSQSKGKTNQKDRLWLNLQNADGMFSQQLVGYFENTTNGYDNGYDGLVSDAGNYVNFYSFIDADIYKIQGREPFDENDQVPLGYSSAVTGTFTINIDSKEGVFNSGSTGVFLEDKLLSSIHNLKVLPYTFTTHAGTFNDRFVLRYTDKTLGTGDFDKVDSQVVISKDKNELKIKSAIETIKRITVFDLLGKKVFEKEAVNSNEFRSSSTGLSKQVGIVKVTLANGQVISKKVVF